MITKLKTLATEERWEEIISLIDSNPEIMQTDAPYVSVLAWKSHESLGNAILAEESLDKAIEISPDNAMLHRAKGDFHWKRGEWKLAFHSFEKSVLLCENVPAYWVSWSYAQEKTGDLVAARESLAIAVELDPTVPQWWLRLAGLQEKIGDFDSARETLENAIKLDTSEPKMWLNLARIYRQSKNLNMAVDAYDKALEIQNDTEILAMRNETFRQIERGRMVASAEYYDDVFAVSSKYQIHGSECAYVPAWNSIRSILEERKATRILDLGCGPGQFAEYLAGTGLDIDYVGIDFSSVAITEARRKCPQFSFYEVFLPVEDYAPFGDPDVLICTEVLEHIEEDLALLSSFPSGKFLILSVPNFDSFAHFRYFLDQQEVIERFDHFFIKSSIEMVQFNGGNILWIMSGVIA